MREIVKDMKLVDDIVVSPFSNFDNNPPAPARAPSTRQGYASAPPVPAPQARFDAFDDDNKAELDASV